MVKIGLEKALLPAKPLSQDLQAREDDLLRQGRRAASADTEGLAELKGRGPSFVQTCQ